MTERAPQADGWLTVPQAAERYGVGRDRLQRAAMEGRLPGHKLGSGPRAPWLVHETEVERFLRAAEAGRPPRTAYVPEIEPAPAEPAPAEPAPVHEPPTPAPAREYPTIQPGVIDLAAAARVPFLPVDVPGSENTGGGGNAGRAADGRPRWRGISRFEPLPPGGEHPALVPAPIDYSSTRKGQHPPMVRHGRVFDAPDRLR